ATVGCRQDPFGTQSECLASSLGPYNPASKRRGPAAMSIDPNVAFGVLTIVGSGAAAWGAAQHGRSSTKEELDATKGRLEKHIEDDHKVQLETVDRLARIETKLNRALGLEEHEC